MKQIYALILLTLLVGCVNDPDLDTGIRNALVPTVATGEVLGTTATTVTITGEVSAENGASVTDAGFCWGTDASSVSAVEGSMQSVSSGVGNFEATIQNLSNDKDYYIRAYAINAAGTAYGDLLSFHTVDGYPSLASESFVQTALSLNYAEFSFTVTGAGEGAIIACGLCYGEEKYPTIATADTIVCGTEVGSYVGRITATEEEQKTYYVRAYATNALGTVYSSGEGIETVLQTGLSTVLLKGISNITDGTAVVSGQVLAEALTESTEIGLCWSTAEGAMLSNCEGSTVIAFKSDTFTKTITGLRGSNTYYLRAYATGPNGTLYGDELSFTTEDIFVAVASFSGDYRLPQTATYCTLSSSAAFFLGGDLGNTYTDELWAYTARYGWRSMKAMPVKLSGQASFTSGFGLWAFGGQDDSGATNDAFYFYSSSSNAWYELTDDAATRPRGKYKTVCTFMDGMAYFVGGYRSTAVDSVWTYNPSTAVWTAKTSFPVKQYGGVAVNVGERIYAGFGIIGTNYDKSANYTTRFWSTDGSVDAWREETSLTEEGAYLVAAVGIDDFIYGVDGDGYIWCYDTTARTWTRKSQLEETEVHCMYVLNGSIYIGFGASSTMIQYNHLWDN